MLPQQIIANLVKQACVSVVFVGHDYSFHVNAIDTWLTQGKSHSDDDYTEGHKLD
jgi:hypothetical protein